MVENNYTAEEAHEQSNRCLQCHVSPVFDGTLVHQMQWMRRCVSLQLFKASSRQQAQSGLGEGNMRRAVDNFYGVDSSSMSDEELAAMGNCHVKR